MSLTITVNGNNWMLRTPTEYNKKFRLTVNDDNLNSYDYEFKTFDEAVAFIKGNLL